MKTVAPYGDFIIGCTVSWSQMAQLQAILWLREAEADQLFI
jgi:hypothetical protein